MTFDFASHLKSIFTETSVPACVPQERGFPEARRRLNRNRWNASTMGFVTSFGVVIDLVSAHV